MRKITILFFSLLLAAMILMPNCSGPAPAKGISDPSEFTDILASHTDGLISVTDQIIIQLTTMPEISAESAPKKLIRMNPSVVGEISWSSPTTLVFTPENTLSPGTNFEVTIDLSALFPSLGGLQPYTFKVKTFEADFSMKVEGYQVIMQDGENLAQVVGKISSSDKLVAKKVEKALQVQQKNVELEVSWNHDDNGLEHTFLINGIQRGEETNQLRIVCEGSAMDIDREEEVNLDIPAESDFILLDSRVVLIGSPHILLSFSDLLDTGQETQGLFSLNDYDLQATLDGSQVRLYFSDDVNGLRDLIVFGALKNSSGDGLGKDVKINLDFDHKKPNVEFIGKGNIVPTSSGIEIPFMAVNLEALDVRIIKIFQNNVHFFLQDNSFDDQPDLRNVGRPVYNGKISLSSQHDVMANKGSAYSLNLSSIIDIDPGAIYQVELSMRPAYSLYPCGDDSDLRSTEIKMPPLTDYWDNPDTWYQTDWFYYNEFYDWRERENPCHTAYYSPDRRIHKNVIASNIGLMAHSGEDGVLHVTTSNILSGQPEGEVVLEVYNLQQQKIADGKTDTKGLCVISTDQTPFLLQASKGNDRAYLKLSSGSSLSLSQFDVGGREVQKGLKGYLFGERDVWRPGDSIYISLIVQDAQERLIENHPVVFELYNPAGQLMDKTVSALNGPMTTFRSSTTADAVTGSWNLVASVGGIEFTLPVRIETIKPNRLKIQFNTEPEVLVADGQSNRAQIQSHWLHGAVADGMETQVDLRLSPVKTHFDDYPGFVFNNEVESYYTEEFVVYEGVLDSRGESNFDLDFGYLGNAPGTMNAVFTTRVFEVGGDFSISQFSKTLHPYSSYVGFRFADQDANQYYLPTGQDATLELAVVNTDGQAVSSSVDVRIYKLQWRWWWDASGDYLGNYISGNQYRPVFSKSLNVSGSGQQVSLTINDEEWGRYLVVARLPNGHVAAKTVYFDWPGGGRSDNQAGGSTLLTLSTDKDSYDVGNEILCSFPSAKGHQALVTVGNGSSVTEQFWINTDDEQTQFSLKSEPEMAPNIYVFVSYLQSYEQTTNDRPIRLYGVIPVSVEDPETHLTPILEMPDELRSQKEFELTVTEENNRAMSYILAIVDEGLLGLTGFDTPDPWNSFYAREALGVRSWDLFDYVLGAYGGTLERLFAVGGDEGIIDPSQQKARRFKPVVEFIGPVDLGKKEKKKHKITLPQYTGAVRVMVVAASGRAYGNCDKSVPVVDPLMTLATAPRVLGINEEFNLPVTVFAQKANIDEVSVKISTNELLTTVGDDVLEVFFSEPDEKDVVFRMKTGNVEGKATIHIEATAGNERAQYDIELDVRNPHLPVTISESKVLGEGKTWKFRAEPIGQVYTANAQLELTSAPGLNLGKRLKYLVRYPHGCIEQTVSAAFPQVVLVKRGADGTIPIDEMEANVSVAIEKLRNFQLPTGGFSYWPGGNDPSDWGTSYAGHFMIKAEEAGFAVPQDMKKNWLKYQKNAANYWRRDYNSRAGMLRQAYRLYTLAVAGKPQTGAMNRLRETEDLPVEVRWKLASAYALTGRNEVATKLVNFTRLEAHEYDQPGPTFGSSLRDRAILLEALTLMNRQTEALTVAMAISESLTSNEWMSTQTTAFCLVAMTNFIETTGGDATEAEYTIDIDGKAEKGTAGATAMSIDLPISERGVPVEVENNSDKSLFVTWVNIGIPEESESVVQQRGIALTTTFKDMDGNQIEPDNIRQGTDFEVFVTVRNESLSSIDNLALSQVFPSGWEIYNERLFGDEGVVDYQYRDIRDDRVHTYFRLKINERKEFRVRLNAAYAGEYFYPGSHCEAMYDHRISANEAGWRVSVEER